MILDYQEARRAAKKASDVTKVDERVNRTVAAANKTANAARITTVKAIQKQIQHNSNNNNIPIPMVWITTYFSTTKVRLLLPKTAVAKRRMDVIFPPKLALCA